MSTTPIIQTNGKDGTDGTDGTDGLGVPAGGAADTYLTKVTAADNDTAWTELIANVTGGKLSVVATLPVTPDANTLYFVTT
jgi:hypothetical protein